jgi:hypothetical protein
MDGTRPAALVVPVRMLAAGRTVAMRERSPADARLHCVLRSLQRLRARKILLASGARQRCVRCVGRA